MSKLENEMKPIVDSILDEQARALDVSSQAVIAAWAIKTTMALEALYPEREFFILKMSVKICVLYRPFQSAHAFGLPNV